MHSRLALAVLFLALTIVFGCAEDRATRTITQSAADTQTWGVLIYAAGNYEGDVLDESDLSDSRAVATVRVMELEVSNPLTSTQACLATPDANDVAIYDVKFGPNQPEHLLNSEVIANLGSVSTGDPHTLATFLETSLSQMDADHYVLCLAGDGHGWQGMMGDYSNPLGMPVDRLRDEIESVSHLLPRGKFDILALYARNMGTLETVYEMRNSADLILTSALNIEQPHQKIISEWYQDLQAQPDLSPEELAAYMIDAERLAQDTSEAVFYTTLWNSAALENVSTAFQTYSDEWLNASAAHAPGLLALRDYLLRTDLHNRVQVDILEYANALAMSPEFSGSEFDALHGSAQSLTDAVLNARIRAYGSEDANGHAGLCYYFPLQLDLDTVVADHYAELELSGEATSWANYIQQLPRSENETVTISGIAYVRPGLTVSNLMFFMDTQATGLPAPVRLLTPQWSPISSAGDSASYSISFSLTEAETVTARFGLFNDNNADGELNSGDRFGFWDVAGGANFEIVTLNRGDVLTGRDVYINFNRN